MIDIATILTSVAAKEVLTQLLKLFKGNKGKLQKAYEGAFQNTIQWYEKRFNDTYGIKNNRFFDFEVAEKEFAKLLFLNREPDINKISRIEFEKGKTTPSEVIKEFINQLREELIQIPEFELMIVERKKFHILMGIGSDASDIRDGINELVSLKKKELGIDEEKLANELQPDPTPIDWQELEKFFREEYRLDRLDYGHLGTSHRDQLEHKLELQKVYVALNVKDRSFDKIMSAAKVNELTRSQYKNLPLLFQRFDDLIHLEREKDVKIFQSPDEVDEKQTYSIARKILHECDTNNLRHSNLILKEITESHRIKKEQALRILALLSNWAVVPRPIAEIPAKERCHLFIGDAGGGKSTACRYMALQCFEDWKNEHSQILAEELGITGQTPLPVYLRLEDFGKMSTFRFWRRSLALPDRRYCQSISGWKILEK